MEHKHEYIQHPQWYGHYVCRICGFAAPKKSIDQHAPAYVVAATTDAEILELADEHEADCFEDEGESAYGRED